MYEEVVGQMLKDAEVLQQLHNIYEEMLFNMFMDMHRQTQENIFAALCGQPATMLQRT